MQLINAKNMQTINMHTTNMHTTNMKTTNMQITDKGGNGAAPVPLKKMRKQLVSRKERSTVGEFRVEDPRMSCRNVDVYYNHGDKKAINNISLDIGRNEVIALIGPSGCGKSTFLRCLNRMNDTIDGCKVTGQITIDNGNIDNKNIDNKNIYDKDVDVVPLRAQVGMVFQKPNPFPKSIYDNIAYGPKIHGLVQNRDETDELVEQSLKRAGLWKEVKDRLDHQEPVFPADSSSGCALPEPLP